MNITTITMPKQEAAAALLNYRVALHKHHDAEYAAITRGLFAMTRGRRVLELSKTIAAGGADFEHRPKLAVMRADQKRCAMVSWQDGSVRFSSANGGRAASLNLRFPADTLPKWQGLRTWTASNGEAIVPMIPPQLLPAGGLHRYHILWEADWFAAPVDPALIQHLGGDLWVLLATWDLSPIERGVISRTRA